MQYDLFVNPLPAARAAFPYVASLQSDFAETGRTRIVAFLAPADQVRNASTLVMPKVMHDGAEYLVFLPEITNVPASMLRRPVGDISAYRDQIVAAFDRLFLGF